jgi:hypothetical protein
MVIIYPDCIASFVLTYYGFCKSSVDSNVMFPAVLFPYLILGIIRDLVMECWPDDLFAIPVIMTFQIGVRDEYGDRLFRGCKEFANFRFLTVTQGIGGLH